MCTYQVYINRKLTYLRLSKANNYWQRLKGWMFKHSVVFDDALWITPCNSIHTFFMNFPIDVIFLGGGGEVIRCCPNVVKRRLRMVRKADSVIELSAGAIATLGIVEGDLIEVKGI